MTSKPVAFPSLADLGVTKTHNRPYTSADNPFSESHFKTLKYRPAFPRWFDSIGMLERFCAQLPPVVQLPRSTATRVSPTDASHGPPWPREPCPRPAPRDPPSGHQASPNRFVHGMPSPAELPVRAHIILRPAPTRLHIPGGQYVASSCLIHVDRLRVEFKFQRKDTQLLSSPPRLRSGATGDSLWDRPHPFCRNVVFPQSGETDELCTTDDPSDDSKVARLCWGGAPIATAEVAKAAMRSTSRHGASGTAFRPPLR